MSKVTRKQIAHAFNRARVQILKRKSKYICSALVDTARIADRQAHLTAQHIIMTRMDNIGVLETWLAGNVWELTRTELLWRHEDMRRYRLRWLDSLIKEFSK